MDIDEFLGPKIIIVSGKGGVGKTTVAAALALVAARHGRKVCIAEVDRKGTLPKLFGTDKGSTYKSEELTPGVWGLTIIPEDALAEYLRVQYHMKRISKVFTSTHFVDYITTAAPGLKDILVLGKIWYLEQNRPGTGGEGFDTIIVDAPAAGHMLTFLSAPSGLADAIRVGPVRRQAQWLVEMLEDPARTRVHLVTLAEEMPVTESLETSAALDGRLGIQQGPIIANGIYSRLLVAEEQEALARIATNDPIKELSAEAKSVGLDLEREDIEALLGYERFLASRRAIQGRYLKQLRKEADQQILELPFLFSAGLALPDIETLADVIENEAQDL